MLRAFQEGIVSAFDIGIATPLVARRTRVTDAENLRRDWQKVGDDLRRAAKKRPTVSEP